MRADAIIFDKDGTLLDFDAYWVSVSDAAITSVLTEYGAPLSLKEKILLAFGIENGMTYPDGILCRGTYEEMGDTVFEILKSHGCAISRDEAINSVICAYNASADFGEIKPTCDNLISALTALRESGIRLAVVTTDNPKITEKCLKGLGIYGLFDEIYTDDGIHPTKPDPSAAAEFLKRYGIKKERTFMVGDTETDAKFAKNAEISFIGIAKSDTGKALLASSADFLIEKISELPLLINGGKL